MLRELIGDNERKGSEIAKVTLRVEKLYRDQYAEEKGEEREGRLKGVKRERGIAEWDVYIVHCTLNKVNARRK